MNDVSRELYIVAGGVVDLLIEQDDQLDFIESTRSAGQVCHFPQMLDKLALNCLHVQVNALFGLKTCVATVTGETCDTYADIACFWDMYDQQPKTQSF